ncbi:leucine-rich repeats and immunoglobulin-like domains protein 1 isoform X1 [Stylophora pistillata]|uniref:leucine-rich repeats and immunoglobulin-like domains protein 1 isoform X1 n=1 Tax=Stylophora pistillata TaxID=50429 RepID=UPI000C03F97F|nr:leucine-rich repeats and immunoglobulin-like domains protein 1 isoform X1 [Stylophora pistillata]
MLRATQQLYKTVFMLIVLFDGLAVVEPRVQIISPVENQIIKFNQSVFFNCTVSLGKNITGTLEWRRDGASLTPTEKSQYWASFEIRALQKDQEGIYQCIYSNGERDQVRVCLAEKPQGWPIKFTSPISTHLDEFPTLSCFAMGCPTPNIIWFKNNSQITATGKGRRYSIDNKITQPGNRTSDLRIRAVQLDDAGDYVCIARNALGSDNSTITLYVKGTNNPLATIEAEKPKYTAEVGTKVTLVCVGEQVKEDVFTSVYWSFKGNVLSNSSKHYIVNDFFTLKVGSTPKVQTELTLLKLDYEDSGNYSCKVVDAYRIESDLVVLEVIPKDDKMVLWLIIVISFAVLLALALFVLIFILWRRRRRKQKMKAAAGKYDHEDGFFTKDVFISYSGKDYDWVKEFLMPPLDHNQINYIIHSRDFVPGKTFIENMADSVYNSRKVILIMSANYLASGFCKDEMYMATHRESARNDASLIVVRIDNSIKTADIPKILRHRTFIDVTSQEEVATWENRILDYVRSDSRPVPTPRSAIESVTSNESMQFSETRNLLSKFKLKKKRKVPNNGRNVEQELVKVDDDEDDLNFT